MKNSCEYLKHSHVPKINTPEAFNLDKYIEKDGSKEKAKAAAWGAGDFASLVRMNVNKSSNISAVDIPQSVPMPDKAEELHNERTEPKKNVRHPKPEHLPGVKHNVGYRRRKIELSEVGVRIDRLLCKNNTNIRRVSRLLGMKPDTFINAMKPDSHCKQETFKVIAEHFDVSYEYLMSGEKING